MEYVKLIDEEKNKLYKLLSKDYLANDIGFSDISRFNCLIYFNYNYIPEVLKICPEFEKQAKIEMIYNTEDCVLCVWVKIKSCALKKLLKTDDLFKYKKE
jgi:hypothetical protein